MNRTLHLSHFLFLLFLCVSINSYAQTPQYSVGNNSGSNAIPLGGLSWADQRCQFLYTAGEFGSAPAGQITTIYFRPANTVTATYSNFRVDIGQNSTTSLSTSGWETGLTTAYTSSSQVITATGGSWFSITLATPIPYDPTMSLVIDTRQTATSPSSAINLANQTATGNRRAWAASSATAPGGSGTQRYDFGFDLITCNKPTGTTAGSITSNSATINWTAVAGSAGYEYVLDQIATAPTGAGTAITATNYNAFGLSSNTIYYFHVRNKCNTTNSSLWETITFTTAVNPCPYPNTVSYNAPTASSADFHWLPMTGSLGYEYLIDLSGANPLVPGTATPDTFANLTGLTGGQTYFFHIRNKCSSTGGTWSDWNTIQFVMPECKAPINILFSNITDTAVDMLWSLMPAANIYEYQLDPNRADPTGTSGFNTTTGITAHINGLISSTKYYAHIRSRCFINDESSWALDSIVTQYACNAPVPVVTNPGATNLIVNWAPVTDAVQYEYTVSSNPNSPAYGAMITTNTTMAATLPSDGKNYYLHIRTKCNSQFEFSRWARADLRVTPTGINTIEDDVFAINVFPNPSKDKVTIEIGGSKQPDGNMEITDMTGKVLLTHTITGKYAEADISKLSPGIYLLKYMSKENNRVIKIEKQ